LTLGERSLLGALAVFSRCVESVATTYLRNLSNLFEKTLWPSGFALPPTPPLDTTMSILLFVIIIGVLVAIGVVIVAMFFDKK
jgi:hypothetical protein